LILGQKITHNHSNKENGKENLERKN